ncbi:MAG: AAA family ATPase [Candidatus Delongbacteria bacterium]|nr:AAA family ATPase [Candidatus Delongbacteria bacterium]
MLSKYIPNHFAEIYPEIKKKGFVKAEGSVMFADLSGFTNLSEKLTAKGKEGSEEVSRIINEVFEDLITIITQSGGSVYKFGGDAVTVFFPKSVNRKDVIETAVRMQSEIRKFEKIKTIAGNCSIKMKIGIAYGKSVIGMVGEDIKQYFIAGDTLDTACECEHNAGQGDIIVSVEMIKGEKADLYDPKGEFFIVKSEKFRLNGGSNLKPEVSTDKEWFPDFIDKELAVREQAGALEKGELRNCAVVFLNFSGITYDNNFNYDLLDEFFTLCAKTVKKYQGFINKIDMGDKGNKIVALFGAPVSTEKNEEFALRAVQEIRSERPAGIDVKIGVNNGNIYFGVVGASHRREFTVMGNTVNLSARLMASADKNEIIISGSVKERVPEVETGEDRKLKLKGITGRFSAFDLIKLVETRKSKRFRLIGRKKELDEYNLILRGTKYAQINIKAEAGLGKSVLVNKLFEDRVKDEKCYLVNCLSYTKNNTYFAVKEFINKFAGIAFLDGEKEKINKLNLLLEHAGEKEAAGLFAEFMGLKRSGSKTQDPSLKDFFNEVCLSIFNRMLNHEKAVLFVEDAHWIDPASADLFLSLLNITEPENNSGQIHFVYRPENLLAPFENDPKSYTLELKNLEYEEGREFIIEKFNMSGISSKIYEQIYQKTKGNPFFMEEILLNLKNSGDLIPDREISADEIKIDDKFMSERDKELARLEKTSVKYKIKPSIRSIYIPDNVNDMVLARIDKLDENSRMILKIASVIGRVFQFDILKQLQNLKEIASQLDIKDSLFDLTKVDLTIFEESGENEYLFKHAITQEVAYETLLFSLRRKYHLQIARLYERNFGENISSAYELLAFHYRHTNDKDKAKLYLLKSAESAMNKFRFKEGFDYLRLYRKYKMPAEEKLESYFMDFEAYRLTEKRKQALAVCERVIKKTRESDRLNQRARIGKMNVYQKNAKYDEVLKIFRSFKNFYDSDVRTEALTEMAFLYHKMGELKKMRSVITQLDKESEGKYRPKFDVHTECAKGIYYHLKRDFSKALEHYNKMLSIAEKEKMNNPKFFALQNIASVYGQKGDMDSASKYFEKVFLEAKKIHNYELVMRALDGLSRVSYVKGDHKISERYIREGIKLVEKTGRLYNKELMLQSLFNIKLEQEKYDEALKLCDERKKILDLTGDKHRTAVLNDNRGDTLFHMGRHDEAIEIYKNNIEFAKKNNNIEMVGHGYGNLANCYAEKGDIETSIKYYGMQIDYSKKHNDIHSEGKALFNLAYTYFEDLKDPIKAENAAENAKKIFEKTGYKYGLDSVENLLKRIKENEAKSKEL